MTTTMLPAPGSLVAADTQAAAASAEFEQALAHLRARVRRSVLLEGATACVVAFAAYFAVTWPIDRLFRLEVPVRAVLLLALVGGLAVWLSRRVLPGLVQPLADDELALALERANQGLSQQLISSVQFSRRIARRDFGADSPLMMAETLAGLAQALRGVEPTSALRRERMRRGAVALVTCGAGILVVAGAYPGFGLWARRNLLLSAVDWPRATQLDVLGVKDGELVVPRGDDFTVEVEAKGVVPETVRIHYEFDGRGSGRETMTQSVGTARFAHTFPGLMDPVTLWAEGGDGLTGEVRVRLVDKPTLSSQSLVLRYPEYMGRPPQPAPPDTSELLLPQGTEIELTGRATKELVRAELAVGERDVVPLAIAADAVSVSGRMVPKDGGLLVVRLVDRDGLPEGEVPKLLVRVVPDKPPRLLARARGVGAWITAKARLPIELTVTDDFGITSLKMVWGVGDSAAVGTPDREESMQEARGEGLEDFVPGKPTFERLVVHDLLPLLAKPDLPDDPSNPVRPGQFVAVRFRASDGLVKDGKRQSAGSDSFTFKVVTEAELLRELTRRQNELRLEFERILKSHTADRAEFADLADPNSPGEKGALVRNRIDTLAKRQRALARSVLTMAQRYDEVLQEMLNNRVAEAVGGGEAKIRRLRALIVEALETLGKEAMPKLAVLIADYLRRPEAAMRPLVQGGYDDVLRAMERILREMKKLETFSQILTDLKDLIRLEARAREKAEEQLKKDLESILRDKDEGKDAGRKD